MEEKVQAIIEILKELYPDPQCALHSEKDYELLIAVRLSAQCTDARVNLVTPALFREFPTLDSLAEADVTRIEELIHSCGFYKHKARDIVLACQMLRDRYGGRVPNTMEELLKIPGVGRKTANLLLGDLYKTPGSVVCDTHCIRIANRLGLAHGKEPEKVERQLRAILPPEESSDFCHRIVLPGRALCNARAPLIAPILRVRRGDLLRSEVLSLQNHLSDKAEGLLLPPVLQHGQKELKLPPGLGMEHLRLVGPLKILQRRGVGIGLALIGPAGGDPVHDHFGKIPPGHGDRLIGFGFQVQIRPVFIVMTVPPLVVHPGRGIALLLPLLGVGAAVPLVIFGPHPELRRRVFGQIVGQALPDKAHPKAVHHHKVPVMGYGFEMAPGLHDTLPLSRCFLLFYTVFPCHATKKARAGGFLRPGSYVPGPASKACRSFSMAFFSIRDT